MRLASTLVLCLVLPAPAADWAHWRGPSQRGVSAETNLPDQFDLAQKGKNQLVWKAPYGCRSTPLVIGERLYFNSHTGEKETEQERVVCLNAKTGELIWEHKLNVFLTDIVSNRVGWTNLDADLETGNIYCHGTQGLLTCFDRDGKVLWQRSLTEEFGRVSGYGGRLTSPLVDGDLVLISMANAAWGEYGRGGCRMIAFDKKTGQVAWWGSTGYRVLDTYQSTPVVAVIKGQRLVITGGADGGVHAFKVHTGEKVWSHLFGGGAINCSPVVDGDRVYIAHGDVQPQGEKAGKHGRVICLDAGDVQGGKPKVVWQVDGPKIKFASPVLDRGRLILNDEDARLYCLDAETGKSRWGRGFKYGSGQNLRCSPVLADGKIYIGDSRGTFYVLEDDEKRPKVLNELLVPSLTQAPSELDGAAAIAHGCLYFATNEQIFCVSKNGFKPAPGRPAGETGAAPPADARPTHLQVFPAEVLLAPGTSATVKARLYDDHGRFLREVKAEWSLGPMLPVEAVPGLPPPPKINPPPLKGTIDQDGKLTVASDVPGQFGNVIARAEGLTGHARVRQVARLPYRQDFEKVPAGAVPGGWVNSQVKFQVRKEGDGNVLVKTATNANALVAQANAYVGSPYTSDYTIEADLLGKRVGTELPGMGIVNSRYTFLLAGDGQLRIVSWEGLLRIDRTIIYNWQPDTWYRLKLCVSPNGAKTVAKGKIWKRGENEPEKWTLEVEDPLGNKEGAPALYASVPPGSIKPNQVGCEVFFDNLAITPNKK